MIFYNKKIIGLFIFSFISFMNTSHADEKIDCDNTSTTVGMVYCSSLDANKSDHELNETYTKIVNYLQKSNDQRDKKTLITLRDAEKAWITFRDKWCFLEAERYSDGGLYTIALNNCFASITDEHNKRLKESYNIITSF